MLAIAAGQFSSNMSAGELMTVQVNKHELRVYLVQGFFHKLRIALQEPVSGQFPRLHKQVQTQHVNSGRSPYIVIFSGTI